MEELKPRNLKKLLKLAGTRLSSDMPVGLDKKQYEKKQIMTFTKLFRLFSQFNKDMSTHSESDKNLKDLFLPIKEKLVSLTNVSNNDFTAVDVDKLAESLKPEEITDLIERLTQLAIRYIDLVLTQMEYFKAPNSKEIFFNSEKHKGQIWNLCDTYRAILNKKRVTEEFERLTKKYPRETKIKYKYRHNADPKEATIEKVKKIHIDNSRGTADVVMVVKPKKPSGGRKTITVKESQITSIYVGGEWTENKA